MPKIKPIDKLVTKARSLRDHHRERHTPSGFAFALADSIDCLDQAHWQKVTPEGSLFFSPRYLRVLEEAGPDNLRQCYALIFREKEPRSSRKRVSGLDRIRCVFGYVTAFRC